jgi:hypothetical protein
LENAMIAVLRRDESFEPKVERFVVAAFEHVA